MQLPRLSFDWSTTPHDFVGIWSSLYNYPQDYLYTTTIHKTAFSIDDLGALFWWKNGTNLSGKKMHGLQKITDQLSVINLLKRDFDLATFQSTFSTLSAIWKIFLLHTIVPYEYPIFDQHVFRSYHFLTHHSIAEIPDKNADKEHIFFAEYITFFNDLVVSTGMPHKEIDEALWSFGKFIKTTYGEQVCKDTRIASRISSAIEKESAFI